MILTYRYSLSIFTLVCLKKRINTVRRSYFVLLVLQMSSLFSYKLGFPALLATSLVCLATVIFIIFEQTTQVSGLKEAQHTLCTQTVLDNIQDTEQERKYFIRVSFLQHHLASLSLRTVIFKSG